MIPTICRTCQHAEVSYRQYFCGLSGKKIADSEPEKDETCVNAKAKNTITNGVI